MIPELARFRRAELFLMRQARFAIDWIDDRLHSWEVNFRSESHKRGDVSNAN